MRSYLLFDSGCSTCSALAQAIGKEVGDRLAVRSLRDPEIQVLLNEANPNWEWKPTLLEVNAGRVRAFTGPALGLHLLMWLGPRRTLKLLKAVKRYSTSSRTADLGRREFLRHSGIGLLATIFLFGRRKSSLLDPHVTEPSQVGLSATGILGNWEAYEGFLFLPTVDAQMPTFVQCATSPILCQVDERHNPAHIGELVWFKSIPELIAYVPFPIYVPATLPTGIEFLNAYAIQYVESGKVIEAIVNFGAAGTQQPLVSVSAQPEFPRPFPIWPVHSPSSDNHIPILPEKISFAPAPGVMQPSAPGYVIHWITDDILYTLAVENSSVHETVADIALSLKKAY